MSHDSGLTTSDSQLYGLDTEIPPENNSFSSDDFCIETIQGSVGHENNTVQAIMNKKFLARYNNSYIMPGNQVSERSIEFESNKIDLL